MHFQELCRPSVVLYNHVACSRMQCRFYTSQSLLKHSRAVMRYSKGHPRCCLPLVSMSATSCVPHSSCSSISIVHQGVVILNQILPVIVHCNKDTNQEQHNDCYWLACPLAASSRIFIGHLVSPYSSLNLSCLIAHRDL